MKDALYLKNNCYEIESNHKSFPLIMDQFTHLFSDSSFELENLNFKIDVYRIELFKETKEEVKEIIWHVKKRLG